LKKKRKALLANQNCKQLQLEAMLGPLACLLVVSDIEYSLSNLLTCALNEIEFD
jgi:hypothetical protein